MTLDQIIQLLEPVGIAAIVIVLGSLIKIKPLELNLFQWLAAKIGSALSREVLVKVNEISAKQDELESKLDQHIEENQRENALLNRREILTFAREILSGQKHTKESFCEVLSIIDEYQKYSSLHPDFPNSRCLFAIDLIKDNFKERLEKADFLAEVQRASTYAKKGVELK